MDRAKAIAADRAHAEATAGRLRLIDIRRSHEWLTGVATVAETIESARFEGHRLADEGNPSSERTIALICELGQRSADRAASLAAELDRDVLSVDGGMQAWRDAGLPVRMPPSPLSVSERERYQRHLALPGVGEQGQLRLRRARVLVVGCGGLGSPCAIYLAAAGVGTLGLVDDDRVELSNLQRQILHSEASLGQLKTDSARGHLKGINSDVEIETHELRLDDANAPGLIARYDLVIDGSDNFETRYCINAACVRLGVPMVYGAIEHFSGQVGMFLADGTDQPCYRCLFAEAPDADDAPNCAEAGVFGVLPGVIGCLQATEAVKWLLQAGTPLVGQLALFDALDMSFRTVRIRRDPACPSCGDDQRAGRG